MMEDRLQQAAEKMVGKHKSARPIAKTVDGPPTDPFDFIALGSALHRTRKIPLILIDPWRDEEHDQQPFKLYDDEKLHELAENIRLNGVITPVRLRESPYDSKRYQTLAGHNRIAAARLAGLTEIEAVVEDVDDDQARLIMVDSNLYQRETLLVSEKAWAYRLRLESMKHQGKRSDLTSVQFAPKLNTEIIGQDENISKDTVKRYIRLTYLIPPFLELMDKGAMQLTAGVPLSFVPAETQEHIWSVMKRLDIPTVTRSQAEDFKTMSKELRGGLNEPLILRILGQEPGRPGKPQSLRFEVDFPPEVVKRLKKDTALQDLIRQTIQDYLAKGGC